MSVVQRTVESVMRQHVEALECALEKLTTPPATIRIEDLSGVEEPLNDGVRLAKTSIHHDPSGAILYVVETTMEADRYRTRGWVPDIAKFTEG